MKRASAPWPSSAAGVDTFAVVRPVASGSAAGRARTLRREAGKSTLGKLSRVGDPAAAVGRPQRRERAARVAALAVGVILGDPALGPLGPVLPCGRWGGGLRGRLCLVGAASDHPGAGRSVGVRTPGPRADASGGDGGFRAGRHAGHRDGQDLPSSLRLAERGQDGRNRPRRPARHRVEAHDPLLPGISCRARPPSARPETPGGSLRATRSPTWMQGARWSARGRWRRPRWALGRRTRGTALVQ